MQCRNRLGNVKIREGDPDGFCPGDCRQRESSQTTLLTHRLIASKEGARQAHELKANRRPTLLVQAEIHAGEIDGKDAGLMLPRDLAFGGKSPMLDGANLLFILIGICHRFEENCQCPSAFECYCVCA